MDEISNKLQRIFEGNLDKISFVERDSENRDIFSAVNKEVGEDVHLRVKGINVEIKYEDNESFLAYGALEPCPYQSEIEEKLTKEFSFIEFIRYVGLDQDGHHLFVGYEDITPSDVYLRIVGDCVEAKFENDLNPQFLSLIGLGESKHIEHIRDVAEKIGKFYDEDLHYIGHDEDGNELFSALFSGEEVFECTFKMTNEGLLIRKLNDDNFVEINEWRKKS